MGVLRGVEGSAGGCLLQHKEEGKQGSWLQGAVYELRASAGAKGRKTAARL